MKPFPNKRPKDSVLLSRQVTVALYLPYLMEGYQSIVCKSTDFYFDIFQSFLWFYFVILYFIITVKKSTRVVTLEICKVTTEILQTKVFKRDAVIDLMTTSDCYYHNLFHWNK